MAARVKNLVALGCLALGGCYTEKTEESTIGTIGKGVVGEVGKTVRDLVSRSECSSGFAAAVEVERQRGMAEVEAVRFRAALEQERRLSQARREHERRLADIDARYKSLEREADGVETSNESQSCPLGDAVHILSAVGELSDRARSGGGP